MKITVELTDGEHFVLQKQAEDNNAQVNRIVKQTPEDVVVAELQPVCDSFIEGLRKKYAVSDKDMIIEALNDPQKLAAAKEALGIGGSPRVF